ncbi:hypothetical protein FKK76_02120 [Klebsiella quasipneumoniae]|nr:hypothetical protein [Klebsiella quasipneumoniae]QFZ68962.1 hypothetical protein GFK78_10395 [Klebsiella quasipneumoniae]
MVSLRLSSSERLAKDSICSISKSPSLHLPENAGAELTTLPCYGDSAKRCRTTSGLLFGPNSRFAEINKNNARAEGKKKK